MVLRPLKYGVVTILIINFSSYDAMITEIWFYTILTSNFFKSRRIIYFKIIHYFEGTLYRKRDYDLKLLFILKNIEGTMNLRPFLIPKGH